MQSRPSSLVVNVHRKYLISPPIVPSMCNSHYILPWTARTTLRAHISIWRQSHTHISWGFLSATRHADTRGLVLSIKLLGLTHTESTPHANVAFETQTLTHSLQGESVSSGRRWMRVGVEGRWTCGGHKSMRLGRKCNDVHRVFQIDPNKSHQPFVFSDLVLCSTSFHSGDCALTWGWRPPDVRPPLYSRIPTYWSFARYLNDS